MGVMRSQIIGCDCMFNSLFRLTTKESSMFCITGPLWIHIANKGPEMRKACQCHDVILISSSWWRHPDDVILMPCSPSGECVKCLTSMFGNCCVTLGPWWKCTGAQHRFLWYDLQTLCRYATALKDLYLLCCERSYIQIAKILEPARLTRY